MTDGASVVRFTHHGFGFLQGAVRWDAEEFWAGKPLHPEEYCIPRTVKAVEFQVHRKLPLNAREFVIMTAARTATKVVRHWAGSVAEHQTLRHLRESLGDGVTVESSSVCYRPFVRATASERMYCYNWSPKYSYDKDE